MQNIDLIDHIRLDLKNLHNSAAKNSPGVEGGFELSGI